MGKEHGRRAFTLVELLVTVTIIALLVMLFIPNMRGMLRKVRTVQCANRLREIGKAVAMCRSEKNPNTSALTVAATWPSDIWPFIEPKYEVLLCPEDAEPHAGRTNYMDILRFQVRGRSWSAEFDESNPWMIRLSQTQYADADLQERKRQERVAYVPDGTPGIYWWGFEDWQVGGSDRDYEDVQAKFTELPDGRIRMDWVVGHSIFRTDLVDNDDEVQCSYERMRSGDPYYWGGVAGGGVTSYGMNANIPLLEGASGKILALDYEQIVADGFADIWDPMPEFARHEGKINVLRMDGSVDLRRPQEIDPAEASVGKAQWQP